MLPPESSQPMRSSFYLVFSTAAPSPQQKPTKIFDQGVGEMRVRNGREESVSTHVAWDQIVHRAIRHFVAFIWKREEISETQRNVRNLWERRRTKEGRSGMGVSERTGKLRSDLRGWERTKMQCWVQHIHEGCTDNHEELWRDSGIWRGRLAVPRVASHPLCPQLPPHLLLVAQE